MTWRTRRRATATLWPTTTIGRRRPVSGTRSSRSTAASGAVSLSQVGVAAQQPLGQSVCRRSAAQQPLGQSVCRRWVEQLDVMGVASGNDHCQNIFAAGELNSMRLITSGCEWLTDGGEASLNGNIDLQQAIFYHCFWENYDVAHGYNSRNNLDRKHVLCRTNGWLYMKHRSLQPLNIFLSNCHQHFLI